MKRTIQGLIAIPIIQQPPNTWSTPWAHIPHKHPSYVSFTFITSIIGMFRFITPHVGWVWALLFIHLIGFILVLKEIFRNSITRYLVSLIILIHSIHFSILAFHTYIPRANIDYRYICWAWIGWAVLYLSALSNSSKWLQWIFKSLFTVGILIQIYILATVTGHL